MKELIKHYAKVAAAKAVELVKEYPLVALGAIVVLVFLLVV